MKQMRDSIFLEAFKGKKTPYTPVWLMRQAGRYMKDYRDIRARVPFLELCKNSDLACEVTVTAQEKLGADAAIIFSDILLILEPLGVGLEYREGEGPLISNPLRQAKDWDRLVWPQNIAEHLSFVMEALVKTRRALKENIALLGFAGAPFTVASYLIEGKGGSSYFFTKQLMYQHPQVWNQLLARLVEVTADYLIAQKNAGADAAQIFDSWVGCLSPQDYARYVLPHMQTLFKKLPQGWPIIHFGTGAGGLLGLIASAGSAALGIDWRSSLADCAERFPQHVLQGNLDPQVLCSDLSTIKRETARILSEVKNHAGGHIFNLGHGVLPQTPVEHARALIDIVHESSAKGTV